MKRAILLALAAICAAAALLLKFALVGYRFSAYILFAAAAVLAVFALLDVLRKKGSRCAGIILIALLTLTGAGIIIFTIAESFVIKASVTDPDAGRARYVIVLGAGVNGTQPSRSLLDRLQTALEFLTDNPNAVAIVSGGQGSGEDMTEAECMYNWLTERGVAPERVIKEEQASVTRENLLYSLDIIRQRENGSVPEPVGVLSSEYHLLRAEMQAEKLGIETVGVAARTSIPSLRVNYFIREAFGVAWEFVKG